MNMEMLVGGSGAHKCIALSLNCMCVSGQLNQRGAFAIGELDGSSSNALLGQGLSVPLKL